MSKISFSRAHKDRLLAKAVAPGCFLDVAGGKEFSLGSTEMSL